MHSRKAHYKYKCEEEKCLKEFLAVIELMKEHGFNYDSNLLQIQELTYVNGFKKTAKDKFNWDVGSMKPALEITMNFIRPWIDAQIVIPVRSILCVWSHGL